MTDANTNTVTTIRRTPIYPSITLVGSLPTVNGVSYYSWAEALAAKAAGVTYRTVDIYGREDANTAPSTKPCAQCGDTVPTGILICAGCARENILQFRKSHAWLFADKKSAA